MKEKSREEILKKRNSLSRTEIKSKSKEIFQRLLNINHLNRTQNVCVYVSKDSEVETHDLITYLLKKKNVFVPFIEKEELRVSEIKNFSDLEKGQFNILEPKNKINYNQNIDLIIIPGVAFDKRGNRLGRGNGYYDKFLKNIQSLKIGLAFEEQIIGQVPVEKHDVPLNLIITDKQIIKP
ncbi:MAG: 5-formyltetrahydrofolate cyclo-ligase [Nanoarchaeota archaeon]|nr:5-formyltetrahydrofolate cyclo-ligase [Nanoarchaeota archaeon]